MSLVPAGHQKFPNWANTTSQKSLLCVTNYWKLHFTGSYYVLHELTVKIKQYILVLMSLTQRTDMVGCHGHHLNSDNLYNTCIYWCSLLIVNLLLNHCLLLDTHFYGSTLYLYLWNYRGTVCNFGIQKKYGSCTGLLSIGNYSYNPYHWQFQPIWWQYRSTYIFDSHIHI